MKKPLVTLAYNGSDWDEDFLLNSPMTERELIWIYEVLEAFEIVPIHTVKTIKKTVTKALTTNRTYRMSRHGSVSRSIDNIRHLGKLLATPQPNKIIQDPLICKELRFKLLTQ